MIDVEKGDITIMPETTEIILVTAVAIQIIVERQQKEAGRLLARSTSYPNESSGVTSSIPFRRSHSDMTF